MIDAPEPYLDTVKAILQYHVPWAEARAFGSRVNGAAGDYSDLDIALLALDPIPEPLMEQLKDAFSASNLPFQVDVHDWLALSPEFRKCIEKGFEVLMTPQKCGKNCA